MGNSLRCCLACVLPCGALDLIRIVHLNGNVEEITRGGVTACEFLQDYPNHVLSKPCSQGNMVRKIMILSPESELKRGSIYFLLPDSSLPSDHSKSKKPKSCSTTTTTTTTTTKSNIKVQKLVNRDDLVNNDEFSKPKSTINEVDININDNKVLELDLSTLVVDKENVMIGCDTKFKSKSKSGKHQRRRSSRGKSGIWQPHLECITEDL